MNQDELRNRLAAILVEEEREVVNWATVNAMLGKLAADLKGSEYPHFIGHFMSDSDIRAKDNVYGDHQRAEVTRFVDTGEYEESQAVSPLGCWLVAAALGGLVSWLS